MELCLSLFPCLLFVQRFLSSIIVPCSSVEKFPVIPNLITAFECLPLISLTFSPILIRSFEIPPDLCLFSIRKPGFSKKISLSLSLSWADGWQQNERT